MAHIADVVNKLQTIIVRRNATIAQLKGDLTTSSQLVATLTKQNADLNTTVQTLQNNVTELSAKVPDSDDLQALASAVSVIETESSAS